ncbi:MAG: MOSC domain-containing protein [Pseudomonadales bacterium]|nr:MOSC domain-containing protein [Pseudomonadales bacterium]MBO6597125.1 MOSC domain-containing protein [Pseudomonadales bacterium]MBO6823688.1 MOSC domain-containing protein [Pseudomonadales bacterium]
MAKACKVVGLYSYPVKSCRGSPMDAVDVSPQGIKGDRQLMILREGKFVNQAFLPKLATVETKRLDASLIEFKHESSSPLVHQVTSDGEVVVIDFYGNQVAVIDQGDALALFVSEAIGDEVRVVGLKETFQRAVPLEEFSVVDGIDQSRFVDVAPILVTSVASLADLNGRLSEAVPMERFRPNIVIEGLEAFDEDNVSAFEGDGWRLVRATHCERCAVTCTDHLTGERSREPLATLKSYRHREGGYAGGVMFGAYMGVEGTASIRIGDMLEQV